MSAANRVKETTSSTSTSAIALGGVAGAEWRTFVAGLGVGAAAIEVMVGPDSAGAWLIGEYTLTNANTLTRTSIVDSSAGGADVTLAAGTKDVYNTLTAGRLNWGLINPYDPGFDIVICAGQSNMVGQSGADSVVDVTDPRVFMYPGQSSDSATYRKLMLATEPMKHYNGAQGMGPSGWFGKTYAGMIPANRKVLLVPVALSATAMVTTTAPWHPGDGTANGIVPGQYLFENAIAQANAALVEAKKMFPNSRIIGTIWLQGESDAGNHTSQIRYAAELKTLIQGFRARMTGASNMWFAIAGMTGEILANGDSSPASWYQDIDAAHRQVAAEVPRVAFAPGITGAENVIASFNRVHYNTAGARLMGCALAAALAPALYSRGVDVTPPVVLSAQVPATATNTVVVTLSEPFDSSYPPQASAWAVSGHTVSAASGGGNLVYLTVSAFTNGEAARTVTFTAPGSGIRDLAGNLMVTQPPVSITNNAPAVDSTAPTLTSATSASTGPNSGSGAVTTNEGNGTLYYMASINATETAATVKASGATIAITSTGSSAVSVSGLTAATVYYLHFVHRDAAGNDSVVADSPGFTTSATADTTAPILSSPAGTQTGSTTGTATVTTDEGNGTLYYIATTNAVESATTVKTGASKSVTAAGTQSVSFAGLAATTTYYSHFVHRDAAGNDSTVANGSGFTTTAGASTSDLQFGNLATMTETSSTPPYAYQMGTNNFSTNMVGGTTNKSATGDFSLTMKLNNVSARQMIGFKPTAATTTYANMPYVFWAEATYRLRGTPTTNPVTTRAPVNNDLIRFTRVGTTVTADVSSDSGATWTTILTWTQSGTVYCQILSETNGQFIGPVGAGWA